MRSHWKWIVGLELVLSVAGSALVHRSWKLERERRFTSQCANHAIQHKFTFRLLTSGTGIYQFSSETNARLALRPITAKITMPEGDWLDSLASACPESFGRDRSIGYLFLADSLKVDGEDAKAAIALICPAENHQRSSEHSHAVMTSGDMECLKNNLEAIEFLRAHLGKAERGEIKYSKNARAVMQQQIEAREGFEGRRAK